MYAISSHWDHFPQGLQALYHDLAQLRRALFEAEDELTPLVLQATRQAGAHMRYKGRLTDATSLGEFVYSASIVHGALTLRSQPKPSDPTPPPIWKKKWAGCNTS